MQHRKEKSLRKKEAEKAKLELDRREQLRLKREELRALGLTTEEINNKLSDEPVQKTGFKFGGVMGSRLVDYGIMSSTSGSEDEADQVKA